ncbi:MAG: adenylate/guanylate cyclase domain-containing protein [Candidatus Binatia bacterium]
MPRLQRKSFSAPDQVRRFPNGRIDVVRLDEIPVGRFVFQPGWRWSRDVAPITGTRSCQHRHVGYTVSGTLVVRMDDGTELVIGPGEAYEIPPGHDAWVLGDEPWTSVEFTSAHTFAAPADELGERVLATIVFSDIVDSTAALERLGDHAWAILLHEHNVRIRAAIDRYRGREMGTTGDGFLALFDGAAKAANAAMLMSSSVAELGLCLRLGIHTGEVEIIGGQARGLAVHAAARVAALAGAGEVLVSGTTHDLLEGSGLGFQPRGVHELKGLRGARSIFALSKPPADDASPY